MYKPLPDSLTIKTSKINGLGVFSKEVIPQATNLGMTHLELGKLLLRTPLGGFINHSDEPNCIKSSSLLTRQQWNNLNNLPDEKYNHDFKKWNLITLKNIKEGEELTLKYTFYKIQDLINNLMTSKIIDFAVSPIKVIDFSHLNLIGIEKYCLMKNQKQSVTRSNQNGFQSENVDLSEKVLKNLINNLIIESHKLCDELQLKKPAKVNNMWVNINNYGNSNANHLHPNCLFSGVFYPSQSYPKDCGNIKFQHPSHDIMGYDWDKQQTNFNKYNSLTYQLSPKRGCAVIFPGWLVHRVEPNLNKDFLRVSMSFNIINSTKEK